MRDEGFFVAEGCDYNINKMSIPNHSHSPNSGTEIKIRTKIMLRQVVQDGELNHKVQSI